MFFIVDDKSEEIKEWKSILASKNLEVVGSATNEGELMNKLRMLGSENQLPQYLILDMKFGGDFKKGSEILKTLRKVKAYNSIKVIVSSAYNNQVTVMEVMGENMANAFVSKDDRILIFKALESFQQGEHYWWEGIPKSIRLSDDNYVMAQSRKLHKKIKWQLLSKEEKDNIDRIPTIPMYERLNDTHDQLLLDHYKKEKLDLPISLDFSSFYLEAKKALNNDFTATQWIIFKELAKGRTPKKVAANCNTSRNNINVQTGNILDKLGRGGHRGNACILLLEALRMPIPDIVSHVENTCKVNVLSKY